MTAGSAPSRVLAVGAHPDDIELFAGATLATWAAAGCEVHHLVCTDGSKGTWDPSADTTALVAARQEEQREAARTLGATGQVVFLDNVDGELVADRETTHAVAAWIRQIRPEVVLGHDPWRRWRLHPDHRAAGFLVTDGVVAARDPHFLTDLDVPHHRPDLLLLFDTEEPDHPVEVDSQAAHTKADAVLAHKSQLLSTLGIPDDDDGSAESAFRDRTIADLAEVGGRFGLPLAEGFRNIRGL
ncbi:MAG: PIG-L family deacetylase [Acidimicrobiia bacterium]|nr:PIG-L family deacetylase [Actinomycetota bacterium]MBL6925422.1 PIG-L family deacetylase [Acidimicrobiia bacterium]MBL6927201.1 PIG-L family deacetylase [Acidimicrobiia bacterium]